MPTITIDVTDEAAAALADLAERQGFASAASLLSDAAADLVAEAEHAPPEPPPPPEVLDEVRRRQNDDLSNSRPLEVVCDELRAGIRRRMEKVGRRDEDAA